MIDPTLSTTSTLVRHDYNGFLISQRSDGLVNLTEMAKASNRNINDFFRLESAKRYIEELERVTGIPVSSLLLVIRGGVGGGGTWAHPMLAIEFGRWVSPSFAIWCDQHIQRLVNTGSTSIAPQLPTDKLGWMKVAVEAEEGRLALALELESTQAQVAADLPATTLGKIIESSKSQSMRIGDFAKVLGDVGRNDYFIELRKCGIIPWGDRLPYQRFIDAGYFRVTQAPGNGKASEKWFPVAQITPKGQTYLAKKHREFISEKAGNTIEVEAIAVDLF